MCVEKSFVIELEEDSYVGCILKTGGWVLLFLIFKIQNYRKRIKNCITISAEEEARRFPALI